MDTDQQGLCYAAVEGVCEDEMPGLGGNKTNANTRLNSKIKVSGGNANANARLNSKIKLGGRKISASTRH